MHIGNSRGLCLLLLAALLERFVDELALLYLNIEDTLLDGVLHDQTPDGGLARLTQTMYAVNCLVLDGRGPP